MLGHFPSDVLANVFSYLTPCSLARAMAACRHWHDCGRETRQTCRHRQPWFIALPTRSTSRQLCFFHDPIQRSWHLLNLKHVPSMTRPVSTNPAVGVREDFTNHFKLYVAGGMFEAANGGAASYEPTLEVFNSKSNKWTVMGSMLVEFAVRLTVWTPNESVYANGVLYWMTSARAYNIMGYEMDRDKWKELGVPMGDTLEFATLVPCDGKVAVVGGTHDGNVLVWELGDGDEWILIERMPLELAKRFAGSSTKCAGIEGGVCLYKDIAPAMVVWRRVKNHKNKWEWCSIDGCNTVTITWPLCRARRPPGKSSCFISLRDSMKQHQIAILNNITKRHVGYMDADVQLLFLDVIARKVGSSTLPNDWKGIIDALVKLNNDNAIRSILRNERNKRLFDKESRNVETITRLIIKYVKLKLISLKVKQSVQVRKVARELEICCGWYLQMTTLILVYNQNAAATRNAKLIGALQKFVGPDVKAFLSHVKPALLSAVEAL
ncbi:unusual floral organs-like protein [Tanacetum coccineum]